MVDRLVTRTARQVGGTITVKTEAGQYVSMPATEYRARVAEQKAEPRKTLIITPVVEGVREPEKAQIFVETDVGYQKPRVGVEEAMRETLTGLPTKAADVQFEIGAEALKTTFKETKLEAEIIPSWKKEQEAEAWARKPLGIAEVEETFGISPARHLGYKGEAEWFPEGIIIPAIGGIKKVGYEITEEGYERKYTITPTPEARLERREWAIGKAMEDPTTRAVAVFGGAMRWPITIPTLGGAALATTRGEGGRQAAEIMVKDFFSVPPIQAAGEAAMGPAIVGGAVISPLAGAGAVSKAFTLKKGLLISGEVALATGMTAVGVKQFVTGYEKVRPGISPEKGVEAIREMQFGTGLFMGGAMLMRAGWGGMRGMVKPWVEERQYAKLGKEAFIRTGIAEEGVWVEPKGMSKKELASMGRWAEEGWARQQVLFERPELYKRARLTLQAEPLFTVGPTKIKPIETIGVYRGDVGKEVGAINSRLRTITQTRFPTFREVGVGWTTPMELRIQLGETLPSQYYVSAKGQFMATGKGAVRSAYDIRTISTSKWLQPTKLKGFSISLSQEMAKMPKGYDTIVTTWSKTATQQIGVPSYTDITESIRKHTVTLTGGYKYPQDIGFRGGIVSTQFGKSYLTTGFGVDVGPGLRGIAKETTPIWLYKEKDMAKDWFTILRPEKKAGKMIQDITFGAPKIETSMAAQTKAMTESVSKAIEKTIHKDIMTTVGVQVPKTQQIIFPIIKEKQMGFPSIGIDIWAKVEHPMFKKEKKELVIQTQIQQPKVKVKTELFAGIEIPFAQKQVISQIIVPKQVQKMVQPTKTIEEMMTRQAAITPIPIPTTVITPTTPTEVTIRPPPPIKPWVPPGFFQFPDLGMPGYPKFRRKKKIKRKYEYKPSLIGVTFRIPQPVIPKYATGLGIRGIPDITYKKKRRKKKMGKKRKRRGRRKKRRKKRR